MTFDPFSFHRACLAPFRFWWSAGAFVLLSLAMSVEEPEHRPAVPAPRRTHLRLVVSNGKRVA